MTLKDGEMARKWALGDRIEYREIVLTQPWIDQEAHFGWEFLDPIVFPPGTKPPFEVFAAKTVHTSADFARQQGLEGTIAPGIMFVGFASDLLVREVGSGWAEHGTLSVRFVHTAGPGDTLHTSCTVRAVNPHEQGMRVLFDVLVVNQHGEHIMEGEAEATVL